MDRSESLKRKHDDIQVVPKRKGLFQEGSYPEHYYPIGDNFFVLASVYAKKVGIHIRKFNRYDDAYYPSTVGLTITPEQFVVVFKNGPPTSIFDVVDINLALEAVNIHDKREFYLLMSDEGKYTLTQEYKCRSGRVYKFPLDVTFSQWNAIKKAQDDVISSYIAIKFKNRSVLETFRTVSKRNLPVEKPVNDRYEEAEKDMNVCLTLVLYKNIGQKKDIRPPVRICDEEVEIGDLVPVRDFNESCMHLNVTGLVRDFEKELCENMLFPEREPLINYLSEQYLKNIKLDVCIEAARKDFCSYEF
ncbi:uncharacterized protein [Parasteatoda tepidariorum]|uniref:uncharacterized protein n=1 Tax=Parasteatoda tepidariorum TaxID=114398 RepID=UPI001C719CFB|nr:uncharacterized protein LOC122272273 [Parasteatoda tepidariorum]